MNIVRDTDEIGPINWTWTISANAQSALLSLFKDRKDKGDLVWRIDREAMGFAYSKNIAPSEVAKFWKSRRKKLQNFIDGFQREFFEECHQVDVDRGYQILYGRPAQIREGNLLKDLRKWIAAIDYATSDYSRWKRTYELRYRKEFPRDLFVAHLIDLFLTRDIAFDYGSTSSLWKAFNITWKDLKLAQTREDPILARALERHATILNANPARPDSILSAGARAYEDHILGKMELQATGEKPQRSPRPTIKSLKKRTP